MQKVYTTTVDSAVGALCLATQTLNILCYLPWSNLQVLFLKMWIALQG